MQPAFLAYFKTSSVSNVSNLQRFSFETLEVYHTE